MSTNNTRFFALCRFNRHLCSDSIVNYYRDDHYSQAKRDYSLLANNAGCEYGFYLEAWTLTPDGNSKTIILSTEETEDEDGEE
jgi:hypothetical protein